MKLKSTLRKILVILLLAVMLFLIGITVYSFIGYRPFPNMTVDNVVKVTYEFRAGEEIELSMDDFHRSNAIMITNDLRIAIPRYDFTPIMGGIGVGRLHFYMNDGKKHTVQTIVSHRKYGKLVNYGYISIDGVQYFIEYSRFNEYENTVKAIKRAYYDN